MAMAAFGALWLGRFMLDPILLPKVGIAQHAFFDRATLSTFKGSLLYCWKLSHQLFWILISFEK